MDGHGSVTIWLERLKDGSAGDSVDVLWKQYYARLVSAARLRLQARHRAMVDEEDVALSAFDTFVRAAQAGRFPRLEDRDDLWQVLLMLTARKAADSAEREGAAKRGGGRLTQMSSLDRRDGSGSGIDWAGDDPDPAEAAALAEGFEEMLAALPDDDLKQIAIWKLEGRTNEEISGLMGKALATVERKLKRIRELLTAAGHGPVE